MDFQDLARLVCVGGSIRREPARAWSDVRLSTTDLNVQVTAYNEQFTIGDTTSAGLKPAPEIRALVKDPFVSVIPAVLIRADYIDILVTDRKPCSKDAGSQVTLVLDIVSTRQAFSDKNHHTGVSLFGIARAKAEPLWGVIFEVMVHVVSWISATL